MTATTSQSERDLDRRTDSLLTPRARRWLVVSLLGGALLLLAGTAFGRGISPIGLLDLPGDDESGAELQTAARSDDGDTEPRVTKFEGGASASDAGPSSTVGADDGVSPGERPKVEGVPAPVPPRSGEPPADQSTTRLPSTEIPSVSVPGLTTPEVTLAPVTVPDLGLPDVTVPDLGLPEVTVPEVTIPPVTAPEVTLPPLTVPTLAPIL